MTAIRIARAATGRNIIVKFKGCYHGHNDALLAEAGSGPLTLGHPSSPGIPLEVTKHTLNLSFNNTAQLHEAFSMYGHDIAGVIIEPIAGNMGCIKGDRDFLLTLKQLCKQHESVLIFDEVMTGFRVDYGGAQTLLDIQPDLTCLGKIIGGGLPVGAIGGHKNLMDQLSPLGPVYQAGTLSGNPLAMTAGLTTLKELQKPDTYKKLSLITDSFTEVLNQAIEKFNMPATVNSVPGMFTLFFTPETVTSFDQAQNQNQKLFKAFFSDMMQQGISLAPSAFETLFLSLEHDERCLEIFSTAVNKSFEKICSSKEIDVAHMMSEVDVVE
jgi:glutamate-1-semialdehyde 2,1-aminomutase